MLLTVKELSEQLRIKPSTLYAWAAQGKIPCRRLHGLVRFDPDDIAAWVRSSAGRSPNRPRVTAAMSDAVGVRPVVARAKRGTYNPAHGETRPTASPLGKEDGDGAR